MRLHRGLSNFEGNCVGLHRMSGRENSKASPATSPMGRNSKHGWQFGTQVRCRWSRDRNDRTAENAFSAPWFFSEMELEPAAG